MKRWIKCKRSRVNVDARSLMRVEHYSPVRQPRMKRVEADVVSGSARAADRTNRAALSALFQFRTSGYNTG
jgi:hypothetical protein